MLQNIGLLEVKIKWPNDILVREQKICGILIENGVGGKGVEESVIGIGLNVNHGPKSIGATCIAEQLGVELSVKNAMQKLLGELEKGLFDIRKNASNIHREYLQNLHGYGQPVGIILNGKEVRAQVQEVRASGEIEIRVGEEIYNLGFKEFEWVLRR
jgi:BirA family biotin operon repressor/biotin-[acetyl-CoA-carboxylase] ligase